MNSTSLLSADGLIARHLPRFESRPQQVEMAQAVERAFEGGSRLLVEAGTGVGKSFAYLVPAILRAVEHEEKIVISTHTIALQEQLIEKDIPFLAGIFPKEFSAALVKGRSNYVGLRRLGRAAQNAGQLFNTGDEVDELTQIERWAKTSRDGSLSDLSFVPKPAVWEKALSDGQDCLGRKCPHFEACFYQKARRRVHRAHLLIVNHAMLLSDLALREQGAAVLPDYDRLILDEAHTLEQAAASQLGLRVTFAQVQHLLNGLHHERTGKGLLAATLMHRERVPLVRETFDAAETFFADVAHWQESQGRRNGRVMQPPPIVNRLTPALSRLEQSLKELAGKAAEEEEKLSITSAAGRCAELGGAVERWVAQSASDWVYWIEHRRDRVLRVTLGGSPLDIGPTLKRLLFDRVSGVVLTSATLATGPKADFSYVEGRLGVDRAARAALGSPFDFARQVTMHVEADMPDPADTAAFFEQVCDRLRRYLPMTQGRAFVLFTSHAMLQRCAERMSGFCRERGYPLLAQGEGMPRSKMLEAFRTTPNAVLFGADTFWAGVDVPGDALSSVIIVKLPFSAPDDPLTEARIERLREEGGNPFMTLQVPEAVLKLRQAFGRLVRTKTDTGIVVILDPRVVTKRYGSMFLDSLPKCRTIVNRGV
ncbi:MAG: putative ATP-dependent helicase DinG [Phycisphaerae bacterium]|nr:putative ATP-dependent helicase DinG [Phycisphaerae bacterium]